MTIHNFLKVAFLSGEKRFSAQTKASYQITTVKKFHFSCGLDTVEYVTTFDCRIYFLYFLRSTDRRNALENFFRRYKQDALDETFLSIF